MFLEASGQREVRVHWKGGKCTGCEVPENPTAANDENLLILTCFAQEVLESHVLFTCEKLQRHLCSPLSLPFIKIYLFTSKPEFTKASEEMPHVN